MLFTRRGLLTGSALALGLGAVVASAGTASAAATPAAIAQLPGVPGQPMFDVGFPSSVTPAQALNAAAGPAAASFPQYTGSIKDGTSTFKYVMAGKNPAKAGANSSTPITTELIPVVVKFSNGDNWDPTVADSCDSGASPLVRTEKSPIFVSQSWKFGATAVGTGQVTDEYERADFWKYTKPGGLNPNYGVSFSMTPLPKVTLTVPNADAAEATGVPCGNGKLGAVNNSWLQNEVQKVVIPALASKGVGTTTFPIFLLHNVVSYVGTTNNCCVLGFHAAYTNGQGALETYGLADYDNSGQFSGTSDVSALSHEVAEWQNDPYGNNPTKPWGHIGQVSGCQSNLEVGDPLSGTIFNDKIGTFTYHVQELAFFSWFFHQKPSIGVNGWYSDAGTFTSPAAACSG